ncbi:MAG: phage terminase large subunit [bacterium]
MNKILLDNDINITNFRNASPASLAYIISKGRFEFPDHIKLLDNLLVKLSRREFNKLIINMPPRHGKSELISRYFPCWYLGTYPSHRIILTCYGSSLAESFGRKVKNIISEFGNNFFNLCLSPHSKSAKRFDIEGNSGGMDFVGAGGAITGKGADLLIIDDPIKNSAEAASLNMREVLWDWFNSTAMTRLESDGVVVVVMTRWHEDDLCGRIIANNTIITPDDYFKKNISLLDDSWILAKLPAIATEGDCIGRSPGEALWSSRFPIKNLKNAEKRMGSYLFSALYQQSPSPASGNIYQRKHFRYFTENDEFYFLEAMGQDYDTKKTIAKQYCSTFIVVDLAVTLKQSSDFTVLLVFKTTPQNDILVVDIERQKCEGANHKNIIKRMNDKWTPLMIGIESNQYQTALIQELQKEGFSIKSLRADKEKKIRALPMQARLEAGTVFFPLKASWLHDFEEELLMFPNATHDDQVDAFAYISYMVSDFSKENPKSAGIRKKEKIASKF